jgi:hypothetical protein
MAENERIGERSNEDLEKLMRDAAVAQEVRDAAKEELTKRIQADLLRETETRLAAKDNKNTGVTPTQSAAPSQGNAAPTGDGCLIALAAMTSTIIMIALLIH